MRFELAKLLKLVLLALFGRIIFSSTVTATGQSIQTLNFSGRYLAAISDGDFLASTYADGKLPAPGVSDRLSILMLPLKGKQEVIAQINASNSVIGAPMPWLYHPIVERLLWLKR